MKDYKTLSKYDQSIINQHENPDTKTKTKKLIEEFKIKVSAYVSKLQQNIEYQQHRNSFSQLFNGMNISSQNQKKITNQQYKLQNPDKLILNQSLTYNYKQSSNDNSISNILQNKFLQEREYSKINDDIVVICYDLDTGASINRNVKQNEMQNELLKKLSGFLNSTKISYDQKIEKAQEEYEQFLKNLKEKSFIVKIPIELKIVNENYNDYYQVDEEAMRKKLLKKLNIAELVEEKYNIIRNRSRSKSMVHSSSRSYEDDNSSDLCLGDEVQEESENQDDNLKDNGQNEQVSDQENDLGSSDGTKQLKKSKNSSDQKDKKQDRQRKAILQLLEEFDSQALDYDKDRFKVQLEKKVREKKYSLNNEIININKDINLFDIEESQHSKQDLEPDEVEEEKNESQQNQNVKKKQKITRKMQLNNSRQKYQKNVHKESEKQEKEDDEEKSPKGHSLSPKKEYISLSLSKKKEHTQSQQDQQDQNEDQNNQDIILDEENPQEQQLNGPSQPRSKQTTKMVLLDEEGKQMKKNLNVAELEEDKKFQNKQNVEGNIKEHNSQEQIDQEEQIEENFNIRKDKDSENQQQQIENNGDQLNKNNDDKSIQKQDGQKEKINTPRLQQQSSSQIQSESKQESDRQNQNSQQTEGKSEQKQEPTKKKKEKRRKQIILTETDEEGVKFIKSEMLDKLIQLNDIDEFNFEDFQEPYNIQIDVPQEGFESQEIRNVFQKMVLWKCQTDIEIKQNNRKLDIQDSETDSKKSSSDDDEDDNE